MRDHKVRSPVALITGARTGIGRACADLLVDRGFRVYGTSRHPPDAEFGFTMLKMDVDHRTSVEAGVRTLLDEAGRLDVVVNNAGFGYGGAVEDTSIEQAKATFETNLFGVLRVCQAVLPTMRSQRAGLIVNVSSVGGRLGVPYQGLYCASKFAVEGMTEALRMEVKAFGIDVVLIEPGDTCTDFTENRRPNDSSVPASVYYEQYRETISRIEEDECNGASPTLVARTLLRAIRARSPRPRYVAARLFDRAAIWAKRWLPDSWFEWIVMKNYGLR
jgi:NAD(P)-dependent dehydrogenase (short-subunit alcohol dehydrogenase family)